MKYFPAARILRFINFFSLIIFLLLFAKCGKQATYEEAKIDSTDLSLGAADLADTVSQKEEAPEIPKTPTMIEYDVLEQAVEFSDDSLISIIYEDPESYEVLTVQSYFDPFVSHDGNCTEATIVYTNHINEGGVRQSRYSILTLENGTWSATNEDFELEDNDKQFNTSVRRVEPIGLRDYCKFFALQERFRDAGNTNSVWSYTSLYVVSNVHGFYELKTVLFFADAYVEEIRDTEDPEYGKFWKKILLTKLLRLTNK